MSQVNPEDEEDIAVFPEGLKFSCRACPYRCSIRDAGAKSVDGLSSDDDGDGSLSGGDEHDDDEGNDGDVDSEHHKYIQSVIEEVERRDPGRISSLLADKEHPDQVFQPPPQQGICLKKPPLKCIAGHMLECIKSTKTQNERYGEYITKKEEVSNILIDNLTSAARKVFNKQSIELTDLINIGGYPEETEGSGIYLHILRTEDRFYLYIGQAYNLKERIEFHNDPAKRATHPSLHYSIWDQIKSLNTFSSIFVKLAVFDHRPRDSQEQFTLNLEEMFLAIVLQTLKVSDLEKWLPEDIPRVWAERGLNVALPLWQGFKMEGASSYDEIKMSGEEFTNMLHDKDELRRQWVIDLRDAYQSLREHPDVKFQEVWFSNFEKFLQTKKLAIETAHAKHQNNAQEKAREFLAHGKQLQIYQTGVGYYTATYSQYTINLGIPRLKFGEYVKVNPRKNVSGQGKKFPANATPYGKVDGKFAFIKPVLFDKPHSLRYAYKALPHDPASRLMILADTDHGDGSGQLRVLSAKGEYAVKSMNRLVDVLEGIDYYKSIELGRRQLSKRDRQRAGEVISTNIPSIAST